MLWVRRDRQAGLHPAVISHGYNSPRPRSRFLEEFDWTGTDDPSPWLTVPFALRAMAGLVEGGWPQIRAHNRLLALEGRAALLEALGQDAPAPDSMVGSLAAVPISDGEGGPPTSALYVDPLQTALYEDHRIEVPVPPWPAPPRRLLRISAQIYNEPADYQRLAKALMAELAT
jgi:isopenicillin-N epimerase